MYNIEIDWDVASGLVKTILIEDYQSLCRDIETLHKMEDRDSLDSDDLEFNTRIRDAMKVVFEYYLADHERAEVLGS